MAAILNFTQKLQNTKNAYISKTMLDRVISTELFYPQGISTEWSSQFSKKKNFRPIFGHFEI